jgi:hypothetical protein
MLTIILLLYFMGICLGDDDPYLRAEKGFNVVSRASTQVGGALSDPHIGRGLRERNCANK